MQNMQLAYNALRKALGLPADDVPPSGEVGYTIERACQLLGLNPYLDIPSEPAAEAPPKVVTGKKEVKLDGAGS